MVSHIRLTPDYMTELLFLPYNSGVVDLEAVLGPLDEVVAYAMLSMAWYIYRYNCDANKFLNCVEL
jgi:hypothetical protein